PARKAFHPDGRERRHGRLEPLAPSGDPQRSAALRSATSRQTGCFEQRAYTHSGGDCKGRSPIRPISGRHGNLTARDAFPDGWNQDGVSTMQDPNPTRPPEDRLTPPPGEGAGPTVVTTQKSSGNTGGWVIAVILAVLVVIGIYYFAAGTSGTDVEPGA